jgi:hypothetical protein
MKKRFTLLASCLFAGLFAGLGFSVAALAAASPEIEALKAELRAKLAEIDAHQQALKAQLGQVEKERLELDVLLHRVGALDQYRAAGAGPQTGAGEPVVGAEQKAEKEAQQKQPPELPRVSDDVGGVLTPRGRLVVEPSVEYLHTSTNRVAIEGFTILPALLIGNIDIIESDRDTYLASLAVRYGITNSFEVELRAPYVWRHDSSRERPVLTPNQSDQFVIGRGSNIGDVEFGLRYQIPRPSPAWPFLVANLQIKSATGTDPFKLAQEANLTTSEPTKFTDLPTGSGFWSVNPSITFIYPSDPVVFFGNVGYLVNLRDRKTALDKNGNPLFGNVDPGDALRLNFGIGIGLNDRSSFSVSYALDIYGRTTIQAQAPHDEIFGSDVTVGRLLLGYSLKLPSGTPLNLAVGIGTTKDAPDSDLTFRVPLDFKLLK